MPPMRLYDMKAMYRLMYTCCCCSLALFTSHETFSSNQTLHKMGKYGKLSSIWFPPPPECSRILFDSICCIVLCVRVFMFAIPLIIACISFSNEKKRLHFLSMQIFFSSSFVNSSFRMCYHFSRSLFCILQASTIAYVLKFQIYSLQIGKEFRSPFRFLHDTEK